MLWKDNFVKYEQNVSRTIFCERPHFVVISSVLFFIISCAEQREHDLEKRIDLTVIELQSALTPADAKFPSLNIPSASADKYHADVSLKMGRKTRDGMTNFTRGDSIKNGYFQRWLWCGTTCWVVINDADREVLLIDPYVSKFTLGAQKDGDYYSDRVGLGETDSKGIDRSYQLDRIVALANFLRYLSDKNEWDGDPYSIVGILFTHEHGDHTGDLHHLLAALGLAESTHLHYTRHDSVEDTFCPDYNGGNGSGSGGTCDSMQSGFRAIYDPVDISRVPIISHYYATENYFRPHDTEKPNPFTHYLVPVHEDNSICSYELHESYFSASARLYNRLSGQPIDCADCSEHASFKLGHFAIQPYVWDHYSILPTDTYRTLAYRIWHADAENSRKSFISGSRGEGDEWADVWNDIAHGYDHGFDSVLRASSGKIQVDMAFYAWADAALDESDGDAASLAGKVIRYLSRAEDPNPYSYIVAGHHDSNFSIGGDYPGTAEHLFELLRENAMVKDAELCPASSDYEDDGFRWKMSGNSTRRCVAPRQLRRWFVTAMTDDDSHDGPTMAIEWYKTLRYCEDGNQSSDSRCYGVEYNAIDSRNRFAFGEKSGLPPGLYDVYVDSQWKGRGKGTKAEPFSSLHEGYEKLVSGSTIHLKNGPYTGTFHFNKKNTRIVSWDTPAAVISSQN